MSRAWEHYEPIPTSSRRRLPDGGFETVPLAAPRDGELVVRVAAAAGAGERGFAGAVVEVVAVQEKDELVLGDRLWVFDRAPCGHCETCRRDHAPLCPDASRVLVPGFDVDVVVLPAWIARRGRVRLPVALSDAAAAAMGDHAGILRALRLHAPSNPLRILVVGDGEASEFAGIFLETRWPDARRVRWGAGASDGYHASESGTGPILVALEHPADLVLCLRDVVGSELAELVAPGAVVLLVGGSMLRDGSDLWRRESTVAASTGAVPDDLEAFRKQFAAFSERWDGRRS